MKISTINKWNKQINKQYALKNYRVYGWGWNQNRFGWEWGGNARYYRAHCAKVLLGD